METLGHVSQDSTSTSLISVFPRGWSSIEQHRNRLRELDSNSWATRNILCDPQKWFIFQFSAQLCPTLWDPMDCSMPGFPVHHQLLELAQIHVIWVGDAIQPYYPLLSPLPPAFDLSQHPGLFQWVSSSYQLMKDIGFSFSISPSKYLGPISFRMDWSDLLVVQGTLKSLLQNHSSKASILQRSTL